MNASLLGERIILNKFRNLGRRSSGVGIHAAQSCVYCSQCDSFIAEKKSFFHVALICYYFSYNYQVVMLTHQFGAKIHIIIEINDKLLVFFYVY